VNAAVTLNVDAAIADLQTIESVVTAQTQRLVAQAAQRYEATARAKTPVGTGKKTAGQRLSTGWQRRQKDPLTVYIANIRPHAHLAAEGFNHVHGKTVAPFAPSWIPDAMTERRHLVDQMTALVQGGLPASLRALEVTP
jgi:hypothetical protein